MLPTLPFVVNHVHRYIPPELPQTSESAGPRPSLGHPDILELGSEEDIAAEITKLENEQQVVLSTLKEKFDAVRL